VLNYLKIDPALCDFLEVGESAEIHEGERLFLEIDRQPIVIFRIGGMLYAIGNLCSHDDGPLGDGEIDGYQISCPRHGARFDIRTGEVKSLPAVIDIPAYPVRELNGKIELGFPKG
jgi:3-phenylpropionate/trans-cinnamate dioxygenase ferredoxin component